MVFLLSELLGTIYYVVTVYTFMLMLGALFKYWDRSGLHFHYCALFLLAVLSAVVITHEYVPPLFVFFFLWLVLKEEGPTDPVVPPERPPRAAVPDEGARIAQIRAALITRSLLDIRERDGREAGGALDRLRSAWATGSERLKSTLFAEVTVQSKERSYRYSDRLEPGAQEALEREEEAAAQPEVAQPEEAETVQPSEEAVQPSEEAEVELPRPPETTAADDAEVPSEQDVPPSALPPPSPPTTAPRAALAEATVPLPPSPRAIDASSPPALPSAAPSSPADTFPSSPPLPPCPTVTPAAPSPSDDDDDDDDPGSHAECIICMMDYEVGDLVSWSRHRECRHAFHYHCLRSWLMTHQDCPICRRSYFVEAGEGETGAREAEEV